MHVLQLLAERIAERAQLVADAASASTESTASDSGQVGTGAESLMELDAAHHHLDYLLLKDLKLKNRVTWLQSSGHHPAFWAEDRHMQKEAMFRSAFPPGTN